MTTVDDGNDFNLYTRTQQIFLQILPYFSAPLSAIGSALIIHVIIASRNHTQIQTYQRLMLGMSIMDFICSFGMIVIGHWAVPAGTEYVVGAAGNDATCAANYYILSCISGSMWYCAFLAVYFMLVVRFNWPKKRIARWVEPISHFLAIAPTILNPVAAHTGNSIHPMYVLPGFCWPLDYPLGCTRDEDDSQDGPPQDDSGCVVAIGTAAISLGFFMLLLGVIIVCMILIWLQVRRADQYMQRYMVGEDSQQGRNKEFGKEALLYIASFFLVFSPLIPFFTFLEDDKPASTSHNRRLYFSFASLVKFVTPLQGLFNAIIYLRRRFLTLTQEGEQPMSLSTFVAYVNATEPHEPSRQEDTSNPEQSQNSHTVEAT